MRAPALLTVFSLAMTGTGLRAQDPTPATEPQAADAPDREAPGREWLGGDPWWNWSRATGDWGGHRTWLEERGVEVGGGLTVDWAGAWSGGMRQRDSVDTLLDVNVALDLEALLGVPETLVFFDAYQVEGRDPSGDIGDFQGVSNIQADDVRELAEAWIETRLGDQLRLKFGKVDFNSEFAFSEEAGEFVHPSPGISPAIQAAPTFPDPSTAAIAFWEPDGRSYLGVGVFDGAGADGIRTGRHGLGGFFDDDDSKAYFTVAEAGTSWVGGGSWGSGRVAVGGFHHSARFDRFDGGSDRGTSGFYAILDQRLWREDPADPDSMQGVGMFTSLGWADHDVAEAAMHVQLGATWTGAIEGRDDDVLGLVVTHVDLSDATGSPFTADETAIELMYRLQVTPAIALKPDLQFIVHPGGDETADDALVGLLRVEITF
ncbi:MAG: carbohydrate porin [Planctomycetota bacterium]